MEILREEINAAPPSTWGKSGEPRDTSKIHVSEILYKIYDTICGTKPRGEQDEADKWNNFESGFMWEQCLSDAMGKRHGVRIGELELDGILLSPDGLNYVPVDGTNGDEYEYLIEEYKCTLMSTNKDLHDMWMWIHQVMCYCKAQSVTVGEPVTKVKFVVLHLCGDYRENRKRVRKDTEIRFTEEEIDNCWRMVLQQRDEMAEAGE